MIDPNAKTSFLLAENDPPEAWVAKSIDYLVTANGDGDFAGSVEVSRVALHLVLGYVGFLEQRLSAPKTGSAA